MHSAYLKFEGRDKKIIEEFRRDHDTLFSKIEAHITVVFPTRDFSCVELIDSIKKLKVRSIESFELSRSITYDGEVGYLNIVKGFEYPVAVHGRLCDLLGIESELIYNPHVTVVRNSIQRPSHINISVSAFRIKEIVVEKILENGSGQVVYRQKI